MQLHKRGTYTLGAVQKFGQNDNWVREPHEHHFSWKLKKTRYNLPRICSLFMFFTLKHNECMFFQGMSTRHLSL